MIPKSGNRFLEKIMRKKNLGSVMQFLIRVALIFAVAIFVLSGAAALAAPAENGKKAFVANGCWQCHGFEGQGSAATSNGTVIAHTELPFDAFENFVRSTKRAMPPYREAILSKADLADIYAYLQSVPKPPAVASIPLLNP
jgi:mono/diheme cytochrome c family protein